MTTDSPKEVDSPSGKDTAKSFTSAADNPVRFPGHDRIGRTRAAELFAKRVLNLDASEGVIAISVDGGQVNSATNETRNPTSSSRDDA